MRLVNWERWGDGTAMGRVREVTSALKLHDNCLYAQETKPGRIDIYRKSKFGGHLPNLVMSLTDDWTVKGHPVSWGIDVILNRLKAHDLWRDDTFVDQWIKTHEESEKSKERDFHNSVESFLYDFRSQFHRATNEFNTAGLRKRFPEREKRYGNR